MSAIKPIILWGKGETPNPKKVMVVLEELGIPYKIEEVSNPKDESFVKINPNGRLPAIQDPNANDLTLWESGAIVEYLVETYDKEGKLTFRDGPEKWYLKQYLHFQMSGQGPYFGQAAWFHFYHKEDVHSAKQRYEDQIIRVFEVLDNILEGKDYLVGNKLTYADLSFLPWDAVAQKAFTSMWEKAEVEKKYPNFWDWHQRISARHAVKKVYGQ